MSQTLTVRLEKPIVSVKILDTPASNKQGSEGNNEQIGRTEDLEAKIAAFSHACQIVKDLATKLNQFYDKVFSEHKGEIAKLSVEIARKVLMNKVQKGDYEIESIVKEALKNAPTHQDVVVHLNPEDHAQCQKALQDDAADTLAGIKFVADSNVGRAECRLESPKGIIESLIDENLERIGKALEEAG